MLLSFLKSANRNFIRNGFYSAINVLGLSVGITCAILIFSIIRFEISYDDDQSGREIYRVITEQNELGELSSEPGVPALFAEAFRNDFPEAENVTLLDASMRRPVFSVVNDNEATKFFETPVYVDPDFFKVFQLKWIEGSPEAALPNKNSLVITRSVANKYFRNTNVLGETITQNGDEIFSISAVIEDFPPNSSFDFNIFLPVGSRYYHPSTSWNTVSSPTQCYFTLKNGVNPSNVEPRLTDFLFKYRKKTEKDAQTHLYLQKVSDIHFNGDIDYTFTRTVEMKSLYALGLIGLFLILTATINFINLNTVQVVKRSKEIGIRKVMGSKRTGLIFQFLSETSLITIISIFISLGFTELSLIHIDKLLGYSLVFGSWLEADHLIFLLILFVVITILSGWYPAVVISGFRQVQALRNKLSTSSKSSLGLRRTLVVFQFVISQVLIVCTLIVGKQMNFFTGAPMGFEKNAVVEVKINGYNNSQLQVFKNELLRNSAIQSVSYSNTSASSANVWVGGLKYLKGEEEMSTEAQVKWVDSDFAKTYGLEIVEGEDLMPSDTTNRFLVNEEFVKAVGASTSDQVIGNYVKLWGEYAPISGVVKNFFSASMHEKIAPVIIGIKSQYLIAGIKINAAGLSASLSTIEDAFEKVFPKAIFEYDFLDEKIAKYYSDEQRENILFAIFSSIAILIGCLGLLGLVSFIAQQRVKEMGIRKVFGASVLNLLKLFTGEFVVLILIAFAIAAPISYMAMNNWLSQFPYRIEITVWIFAVAVLISLMIAILTVGYRLYSTATKNPVEVLRDE